MKYAPLIAMLFSGTPALAHHETGPAVSTPFGLAAGLVLIGLATLAALRLHAASKAQ